MTSRLRSRRGLEEQPVRQPFPPGESVGQVTPEAILPDVWCAPNLLLLPQPSRNPTEAAPFCREWDTLTRNEGALLRAPLNLPSRECPLGGGGGGSGGKESPRRPTYRRAARARWRRKQRAPPGAIRPYGEKPSPGREWREFFLAPLGRACLRSPAAPFPPLLLSRAAQQVPRVNQTPLTGPRPPSRITLDGAPFLSLTSRVLVALLLPFLAKNK